MLIPAELIKAKRDGQELAPQDIRDFINGIAADSVSDAQIGAFTMAVHFQGMTRAEQSAMTLAMRDTGHTMHWPGIDGPVLDKHSTGGVGDLVSMVLAPMLAACGAFIPMISGRGLGHTGGTLDKLESIPGFNVNLSRDRFDTVVRNTGLAFIGQGSDMVPADGRVYAVRDVTATVDSIPLIVASILSKKLAEGLDGLVLDIKTGNSAFMCERNRARDLAANLVEVSEQAGLPCRALITDMNQPLAGSAGNSLEILEVIEFLTGGARCQRLQDVVMALAEEMLLLGGLARTPKEARSCLDNALASGFAAELFSRTVSMQGGPDDLLDRPHHYLKPAPVVRDLTATTDGCVEYMDTRRIGLSIVGLGGGRRNPVDSIDHSVGLSGFVLVGDTIDKGAPLVTIHAASESDWQAAARELSQAIVVGKKKDPIEAVYEHHCG